MTDRNNVEFVTTCNENGQRQISGFNIVIDGSDYKSSEKDAHKKAKRLTDLLSATSGTYSDCALRGYDQINGSRVGAVYTSRSCIRNKAITDISDAQFEKILNRDSVLSRQLSYIRKARLASKSLDWASVIRWLAMRPLSKDSELKCLRDLLSHDRPNGDLRKKIESLFPDSNEYGIKLDENGHLDLNEEDNVRSIRSHSKFYLNSAHGKIRSAVKSERLP